MRRMGVIMTLTAPLLAVAGCGPGDDDDPSATTTSTQLGSPMTLSAPAFDDGAEIPQHLTCDGADESPELRVDGVPEGADELRLVVEDPDAPSGPFVHWSVIAIPPSTRVIPAGEDPPGEEQENDFGRTGYGGPCPPEGDDAHRYVFRLRALDASGAPLATAELEGTYAR